MGDSEKKKNLWEEFSDSFKEEYNKKDESPKEPLNIQISKGLAEGFTETISNPIKWFFSIFK